MNPLRRLFAFFHRTRLDREMAEEMEAHLQRETEQNVARGLPPEEARYAARRAFGGLDQLQERERDARGLRWIENTLRDLRFAARALRKNPGFTVVAILSLTLGIGACTAVFSVANAILLRSLPVPNPQELRVLHWSGTDVRMTSYEGDNLSTGNSWFAADSFSPSSFFRLREQAAGLADVFGFAPADNVIARARGDPFTARGLMVSDNFLTGLGVQPAIGRLLGADDDYAGPGAGAVISYAWWERHFSLDPGVLGQSVGLNGRLFTIVGVLPRDFAGVQPGHPVDFCVPLSGQSPFLYLPTLHSDFHWFVRLMARLEPGVRDAQLEKALDDALAPGAGPVMKNPSVQLEAGFAGPTNDRGRYRQSVLLMLGIVGMVMLVASANVAGLALARGAARRHELGVRAALGAGRWCLIRQSLTESFVLAALGGTLGVLLAVWLRSGIVRVLTASGGGLHYDLSFDRTVLTFSVGIAFFTAVVAGLLPAIHAGRTDPLGSLRDRGALGTPRLRAGRFLVVVQLGLSVLLLAGAGLFMRSLVKLASLDPGFNTQRLLLCQLNIRGSRAAAADPGDYYARVQNALAALPGARSASLIEFPLLGGAGSTGDFTAFSGSPAGRTMATRRLRVGETFFATMGIPILRGRGFSPADGENAPKVIVVNETFVRRHLPDQNPLGLSIHVWDADWEIVGVCRDARYDSVKSAMAPTTYFPFRQMFYSRFRQSHLRSPYFAVRTALPPLALASAARSAVAAIDPDVALADVTTQEEVQGRDIGQERLLARLCGALAGAALLLAAIGLYGLMAYNVTRRTGEIGVRMALGATPARVARPILREALVLAAAGIGLGVPAALGLDQLVKSQLFGVAAIDPLTFCGAALVLALVALLAAWVPAKKASRVDPIIALRAD